MARSGFQAFRKRPRYWAASRMTFRLKMPAATASRWGGAVWFWDHETDDLLHLSISVEEFVSLCVDPAPVELDPKRVKSVWIDPAFAKPIGKKTPPGGWIKKPSKLK
jgi:hypothetical protein